ncbi:hypothetical protein HN588_03425 [Candidatus Bathyarchaeota archaeon]|nr:hypothetical protein [Candidatus Bathyarchaeota archaeon]
MGRTFVHNQLELNDLLILTNRSPRRIVSTTLILEIKYGFTDVSTSLLTTYTSGTMSKYSELRHAGSQRIIHRNSANVVTILRAGRVLYEST